MKEFQTILLEKDGPVATLCFNRSEQFNAISFQMMKDIDAAITYLTGDPEVKVIVFTGKGKAFCAGVDLKDASSIATPLDSYLFLSSLQRLFNRIAAIEIPTVGAINGVALGGGFEMSLTFDFLVAGENVKFGVPEINVGVLPGGGGMSRLPKKIGTALAKRLIMLGENLTVAEAQATGLVYKVTKTDELMAEARNLAGVLADKPPYNLKLAKKVLDRVERMETGDAMDFEAHAAALLYNTDDRQEGMQAFLEKRKPVFKGK